jgi:hypothetical protein
VKRRGQCDCFSFQEKTKLSELSADGRGKGFEGVEGDSESVLEFLNNQGWLGSE